MIPLISIYYNLRLIAFDNVNKKNTLDPLINFNFIKLFGFH